MRVRGAIVTSSRVSLEILNRALVLLGSRARPERAQVTAFSGLSISFPRIEAILAGFEFTDHRRHLPVWAF